jgi:endonuclease-8
MPEGHTLYALAARLDRAFAGAAAAVSSPQGRFDGGAALLDGRVMRESSSWGKHLFAEFAGDAWLHVHLGLIGKFDVTERDGSGARPPIRGQVRLRLCNDSTVADLRGATLCAVVTPEQALAVRARLGPDPLRPDSTADLGWGKVARSGRTVAELLMDQSVIAGIGNVYRCEVLFRHRVDPFRPGRELRHRTWTALWDDLVALLPLGVAAGQILSMADQVEQAQSEVTSGLPVEAPERRYYVYKRTGEPCRVCGSRIRTAEVAGRNLFWCGRCQRRR